MLKLCGGGLIVLGAAMWGFLKAMHLKKREEELSKIISGLAFLENEIVYEKRDIKYALSAVGKISGCSFFSEAAADIEQGIAQAVKSAMGKCCENLSGTDKSVLLSLGENLGMSDTCTQVKSILHTKEQLLIFKNQAICDYEKFGKMYKSIGVLSGLAIVILLT